MYDLLGSFSYVEDVFVVMVVVVVVAVFLSSFVLFSLSTGFYITTVSHT